MSEGFKDDDHIRVELKRMVENFRLRMIKVLDDADADVASRPDNPAGLKNRNLAQTEKRREALALTVQQMNDFIDRR